jgi:hypothetical protein
VVVAVDDNIHASSVQILPKGPHVNVVSMALAGRLLGRLWIFVFGYNAPAILAHKIFSAG